MTPVQLIALIAVAAMAAISVRRVLLRRSITHYDVVSVQSRLKERPGVTLLDVRTAGERSRGHIKGSLHIPLHELGRRADELKKFRETEIVCYCASGNRSLSAAHLLKRRGYRTANLSGGWAAWRRGA